MSFDRRVRFDPTSSNGPVRIGTLTIPLAKHDADKAAWIVDGQQRAAALHELDRDSFPVWVTAFTAQDVNEQREQFILVNHTRPLPAGLIHELLPVTAALLPRRLAKNRFPAQLLDRLNQDEDSPLHGRIRTPTTPAGTIKDTAVLSMLNHALSDGALYRFRSDTTSDVEAMLRSLKDYWSAVAGVFSAAWTRPPRLSRLTHGAGFVAMGFVMDEIAEQLQPAGPSQHAFTVELSRLKPYCHWTPEDGDWEIDGHCRRWNEFQNTPKDTRRLAGFLCRKYRRAARNAA